jgi:LacI family transcriptional regulator
MEHLLELGHRRIGLICGPLELSTSRERRQGYLDALADAAIPIDAELIKVGPYQRAWGYTAMYELLALAEPPSAVLATSNEFTVGVLHALTELGIRYPEELSLVGFGDPAWFSLTRPPITTVALPAEEMASMAASLLLQRIGAASDRSKTVICRLNTQLVVRASTTSRTE